MYPAKIYYALVYPGKNPTVKKTKVEGTPLLDLFGMTKDMHYYARHKKRLEIASHFKAIWNVSVVTVIFDCEIKRPPHLTGSQAAQMAAVKKATIKATNKARHHTMCQIAPLYTIWDYSHDWYFKTHHGVEKCGTKAEALIEMEQWKYKEAHLVQQPTPVNPLSLCPHHHTPLSVDHSGMVDVSYCPKCEDPSNPVTANLLTQLAAYKQEKQLEEALVAQQKVLECEDDDSDDEPLLASHGE